MANKHLFLSLGSLVLLSFYPGCGSDKAKTGSDVATTTFSSSCVPYCKKELNCHPQLSEIVSDCSDYCTNEGSVLAPEAGSGDAPCDLPAVKEKLVECSKAACADFDACAKSVAALCAPLGIALPGDGGVVDAGAGGATGTGGQPVIDSGAGGDTDAMTAQGGSFGAGGSNAAGGRAPTGGRGGLSNGGSFNTGGAGGTAGATGGASATGGAGAVADACTTLTGCCDTITDAQTKASCTAAAQNGNASGCQTAITAGKFCACTFLDACCTTLPAQQQAQCQQAAQANNTNQCDSAIPTFCGCNYLQTCCQSVQDTAAQQACRQTVAQNQPELCAQAAGTDCM
ncbi:MAG TPA: hypothetical protein VH062_34795 [Polyangiaceae bacterium]|nr:hypothetical protein [Polyangiaceae bacterium]